MTCSCVDVEIGSYDNQTVLPNPPHQRVHRQVICVDTCLVPEITALWMAGIRTTGCCCGHNKANGFIGVDFADIPRMKAMGYMVRPNECRPGGEDSFWPKSLSQGRLSAGGGIADKK